MPQVIDSRVIRVEDRWLGPCVCETVPGFLILLSIFGCSSERTGGQGIDTDADETGQREHRESFHAVVGRRGTDLLERGVPHRCARGIAMEERLVAQAGIGIPKWLGGDAVAVREDFAVGEFQLVILAERDQSRMMSPGLSQRWAKP